MSLHVKSDLERPTRGHHPTFQPHWLTEMAIPGLFMLILVLCLAYLGYCALHAQAQHTPNFQYAISAFAN